MWRNCPHWTKTKSAESDSQPRSGAGWHIPTNQPPHGRDTHNGPGQRDGFGETVGQRKCGCRACKRTSPGRRLMSRFRRIISDTFTAADIERVRAIEAVYRRG
jgi:hypothetical protein